MGLYGIYGSHTTEACPLNNQETRKFVIEGAIVKAAEKLGVDTSEIQKANLITEDEFFYYGQKADDSKAIISWEAAEKKFNLQQLQNDVKQFNSENKLHKKGLALMPICFGISFTSSFLNQASALVHIYTDGSIGVSTAAIEMGQGVNEKVKKAVANTFSVNLDRIKIESTNTTRIANTSATAASSGADDGAKRSKSESKVDLNSGKAKLSSKQYELINRRRVDEKKPW